MEKTCILVGSGYFNQELFKKEKYDYLIAVDGGYDYLSGDCDLLIGDFDSIKIQPSDDNQKILGYPKEKNYSDMFLALKVAIEKGYKTIKIYGGTGGRISHSIANFYLLKAAAKNKVKVYLIGETYVACALNKAELDFEIGCKGNISVFSLTDQSKGVTIKNLKYTLNDETLKSEIPIGLSNEFIAEKASISIKEGTILVLWNTQKNLPTINFC